MPTRPKPTLPTVPSRPQPVTPSKPTTPQPTTRTAPRPVRGTYTHTGIDVDSFLNRDTGSGGDGYGYEPVIKDTPQTRDCLKYIGLCREALAAGDVKKAKSYAFRASSRNRSAGNVFDAEIEGLYDEINGMGSELMAQADKLLEEGKVVAAVAKYEEIVTSFGTLDVGREASNKITSAKRTVTGQPWLSVMETEAKGVFGELVVTLKSEWKRLNADTSGSGQKVEAHDIIMQLGGDRREQIKQRLAEMVRIYGASSYGMRVKRLLDKVEAAERIQLSATR